MSCNVLFSIDKPSAPGPLSVSEVGSNYANLTWSRPANDGGGRILGYFIEKREHGSQNWSRTTPKPIQSLSVNLPNLIEDKSYEFRVMAVNEAGESAPSTLDQPVLIHDPRRKLFVCSFHAPMSKQSANSIEFYTQLYVEHYILQSDNRSK